MYPGDNDETNNNFINDWREIFAEEYQDIMGNRNDDHNYEEPFSGKLEMVEDWPVTDLNIGQVGGLATDPEGYLHVFHRADRTWEARSATCNYGPIYNVET